jgi:hypothetical protein
VPPKHSVSAAHCQNLSGSDRFQRKVQHTESTMDANAMMNGGHVRHGTALAEAKAKSFSKHGNRPTNVQQDVAGPILNTVAVLKVLRQALYEFREEYDWQRHKKYDTSPDDCLNFTEYGIDELLRALEALGELETIIKAYERISRTQHGSPDDRV